VGILLEYILSLLSFLLSGTSLVLLMKESSCKSFQAMKLPGYEAYQNFEGGGS